MPLLGGGDSISNRRPAGGNACNAPFVTRVLLPFVLTLLYTSFEPSKEMRMVAKIPSGVGPQYPQVLVLVGATGDLARRKLLPGLFHLSSSGFIPGCRIIGVSLDEMDSDGFRQFARDSLTEFSTRKVAQADWDTFAKDLQYMPLTAGAAVLRAERSLNVECRRLHYLSVPPNAALSAVRLLGEADLVDRSRIIMEKPFGTNLASAVSLNNKLHEVFDEGQIFRIDHFLGKEA